MARARFFPGAVADSGDAQRFNNKQHNRTEWGTCHSKQGETTCSSMYDPRFLSLHKTVRCFDQTRRDGTDALNPKRTTHASLLHVEGAHSLTFTDIDATKHQTPKGQALRPLLDDCKKPDNNAQQSTRPHRCERLKARHGSFFESLPFVHAQHQRKSENIGEHRRTSKNKAPSCPDGWPRKQTPAPPSASTEIRLGRVNAKQPTSAVNTFGLDFLLPLTAPTAGANSSLPRDEPRKMSKHAHKWCYAIVSICLSTKLHVG